MVNEILNIIKRIYLLIIISVFIIGKKLCQCQNIVTLSYDKIAISTKDGIYFYNSETIKEKEKKLNIKNKIITEISPSNIVQFSEKDEEYIIILYSNIIHFYNNEGSLISYKYLPDTIKGINFSLIPYKKENNYLHYLIIYQSKDKNNLIIGHFKFNINSPKTNTNEIISLKTIKIKEKNYSKEFLISKINCLFISPLNLNRDILSCFYAISNSIIEINAISFDPENNFNKLNDYSNKYEIKDKNFTFPKYISCITNKEKNKALIYLVNGYPYIMTFDFVKFTLYKKLIDINALKSGYAQNKLLYLKENNEILLISSIKNNLCKLYIVYFNSNYEIKYQGVIDQQTHCNNLNSFSAFPNGTIYTIIEENDTFILKGLNSKKRKLVSNQEKCASSTPDSQIYDLCTTCAVGYKPAEVPTKILYDSSFVDCFNDKTKPNNFYFDSAEDKYKPCYETCGTCNTGGNPFNNNCLTCALNHRRKPNIETDCVTLCTHFYYYTFYGQYKCSNGTNCPEEAPLYILDLKKCTDDCSQEDEYKYRYGGQCLKKCPSDTILSEDEKTCIEVDTNKCILSETKMEIESNSIIETVNLNAKIYAEEFGYTSKHISYYYNDEYSILLYKDNDCIQSLSIDISKIDFESCYNKVKGNLNGNDNIIIAIVERFNSKGQSTSIFYLYHPDTGEKINIESVCADDTIIVKTNIMDQLNNTDLDYDSLLFLTEQNIDIFNLDGEFYTDICFHFESPNGKDVPLKDRVLSFYPNVTLCDDDCTSKGVNLTTMESICECTLSGILNNDLISGNILFEKAFGDAAEFISNSNLDVLQCYEDVFKKKYFVKNTGGIIILIIIILEIIFGVLFLVFSMKNITRYLFNLSEFFSSLIVIRSFKNKQIEKNESKEMNEYTKDKIKIRISGLNPPPKKDDKNIIINKNKNKDTGIKETEIKIQKKSLKSLNKLDIDDNKKDISSQKSFDYLYKDKFTRDKINKNILKKEEEKENIEKIKNKNIEIFKLNNDEDLTKKDFTKELKTIQDKYGIDEKEYLKTDPDDMEFDDAIKYDKRTFLEYFYSKFMENQIIMNTFFNSDQLKPMFIKIILLLLNIDLYFVVNGLFYSESYISELFHSEEEEHFFSYFPRSISRVFYTSIIGVIISSLIDCMFIEEKKVKRIFTREKENHLQVKYEISLIIKSSKKNYIIFICISLFISLFSWYYVCCFNNVYPGVKGEWIKSSITIMIIMQLLSILAGLAVALIRLISFKCKSEKLYKLKDFFN